MGSSVGYWATLVLCFILKKKGNRLDLRDLKFLKGSGSANYFTYQGGFGTIFQEKRGEPSEAQPGKGGSTLPKKTQYCKFGNFFSVIRGNRHKRVVSFSVDVSCLKGGIGQ